MALDESPFPNGFVSGIHTVGWTLILPCFWCLNHVIAICKSTTLERIQREEQECYLHPLKVFFGSIFFFLLFLITAPLAFLGFLLWAPLQWCRRPFYYHKETSSATQTKIHSDFELGDRLSIGFATANLCLLPESLARFNNLGRTHHRASAIGQRIVEGVCRPDIRIFIDSPSSCGTLSPSNSIFPSTGTNIHGATVQTQTPVSYHVESTQRQFRVVRVPCDDTEEPSSEPPSPRLNSNQSHRRAPRILLSQGLHLKDDVPWEVSSMFPANVDMLCLEEVFDKKAAQKLVQKLKPVFGHILYDVGVYACQPPCRCTSFKFFNSGLFLASRFPVLTAQYKCFPNSRGEDALAAKGLLSVKVLIGQNKKQKKMVGYFNCTHLHAPEGDGEIRCKQLDMVAVWITDFQFSNKQADEEVIFDVLCGDLNFDNCSPDDHLEQNHSLFDKYTDPCRAGPGKEKPWVIGTLLEQPTLYEDDVKTPDSLQKTLERDDLRKHFVSPPVPVAGKPLVYPETGQPWIGRRIDYILYRESSISKQCRTKIEEMSFITHLAGLTDHIPVGLRLNVIMEPDCGDG